MSDPIPDAASVCRKAAMTGEKALHEQFMAYLFKQGLPFSHSRMDKPTSQNAADPDFAVYRNGRVAFVEFKVGKNRLSGAQKARCRALEAAGCTVCLCWDVERAIAHVERELGWGATIGSSQGGSLPDTTKQADAPQSYPQRFFIAQAKDLGAVVVVRNGDGDFGAIRIATAEDCANLPKFTGALVP